MRKCWRKLKLVFAKSICCVMIWLLDITLKRMWFHEEDGEDLLKMRFDFRKLLKEILDEEA